MKIEITAIKYENRKRQEDWKVFSFQAESQEDGGIM